MTRVALYVSGLETNPQSAHTDPETYRALREHTSLEERPVERWLCLIGAVVLITVALIVHLSFADA